MNGHDVAEEDYAKSFQNLLMKLATTYINLPLEEVDDAIQSSLADMGQLVKADRAYLFRYDYEEDTSSNTHEWCNEGIKPEIENLQGVSNDDMRDWFTTHQRGDVVRIPDVAALPDTSTRAVLAAQEIKSLIAMPMMHRDHCLGFVGFDSVRRHRRYSQEEMSLLRLFAELMVNLELRRQNAREKQDLQDQLLHAQKMESLGRLAGGIAHDFNNMLGIIIGHGELAMEMISPDDEVYYDVEKIVRVSHRSAELTRQLLAFARRQAATPRVIDLNETVTQTLRMLRRLIGAQVRLHWSPQLELDRVRIDPGQIEQILANLVVNARDAIGTSNHGNVWLHTSNVTLHRDHARRLGLEPGPYVGLHVDDDGCGLSDEVKPHLFEPFFTTKDLCEGAGLGLSTVYGIIKQNQGSVEGRNRKDGGARFSIYLPRELGPPEETSTEWVLEGRPRETILLVEDEEELLILTGRMLEGLGYKVYQASSPQAAINLWKEEGLADLGVDLLLTDVIMPDLSGLRLARRLQEDLPTLKVLFMSGYTADIVDRQGLLPTGTELLTKPFTRSHLGRHIREVIEGDTDF